MQHGLNVIHLQPKDGEDTWLVVKRNEVEPYDYAEVASCPTRKDARQVVREANERRAALERA